MSGRTDMPFQWFQKAESLDMAGRCELLWTDEENPFHDTTVKVLAHEGEPEQSYRAHKLILAMGSRKLASKLYESPANSVITALERPFIVEIDSLCASVVKLVLEYLYTDNIKESLKWPVVGGLCYAAKELEIPKLADYCENLLDKNLSCEEILVMFQQISTIKEFKFPKYYYIELLYLCYSYILRNGEVILRSKIFIDLTFDQVEQFISSDFLIVYEELSVYKALRRWARNQCKNQGIDTKDILNCQNALRITSEDDLGLLRHIRFLHMQSKLEIPSGVKKSLIPESVYQCQILGESCNRFSEKRRHAQINNQNLADFKKHIRNLTESTVAKIPNFRIDEDEKFGTPSSSNNISQANKEFSVVVSTSKDLRQEKMESSYINNIKVEPNSDAEEDAKMPATLYRQSQNTPLRVINGNSSPLKRKGMIKLKDEIIKSKRLEDKSSGVCKTPTSPNTGTQIMERVSSDNVESTGLRNENCEIYFKNLQKLKLLKIIEDCSSVPSLTKIILEDVEIEGLKLKKFPSICLPKVTDFIVKAKVGNTRKSTILQTLKYLNLEHFVFFYRENESLQFRLSDLWCCSDINVKVSFNEIIVLSIRSFGLTLNYTKNSSFFALNAQTFSQIHTLNLGNCVMQNQCWLQAKYAQHLLHLRLLHVSSLKIDKILRECFSLETFSVWPQQTQTPVLCLDDFVSDRLCSLSIQSHMVKVNATDKRFFMKMKELCLKDCSWDPDFIEMIPKLFPNLRKIFIIDRFRQPGSDLLKALFSLKSLEEICIWNFDEKTLIKDQDSGAKALLSRLKLKTRTNELNFILKREHNGDWEGVSITRKDIPKKIYESFGFENFYSYDSWVKHFWANYDYY